MDGYCDRRQLFVRIMFSKLQARNIKSDAFWVLVFAVVIKGLCSGVGKSHYSISLAHLASVVLFSFLCFGAVHFMEVPFA